MTARAVELTAQLAAAAQARETVRQETIERCAKVCDDYAADQYPRSKRAAYATGSDAGMGCALGERLAAKEIAEKIRALLLSPPSRGGAG